MKGKSPGARSGRLYLDHRMVAPGDVLLELGRGPSSRAIAAATNSSYSHARLAVAGLVVYEALEDGIFPSPLNFESVIRNNRKCLAVSLSDISHAVLLRHELLRARVENHRYDVQDQILEAAGHYLGKPYPQLAMLLRAASLPGLRQMGEWLASRIEKGRLGERDRGVFCSEFVASVFEHMGLDLFTPTRAAHTISPGTLAESKRLMKVPEAVFMAAPAEPTVEQARFMADAKENTLTREYFSKIDASIKDARRSVDKNSSRRRK